MRLWKSWGAALLLAAGDVCHAQTSTAAVEEIQSLSYFRTRSNAAVRDSTGTLHVFYGEDRLRHAWSSGGTWQSEILDYGPRAGAFATAVAGSADSLHVLYVQQEPYAFPGDIPTWTCPCESVTYAKRINAVWSFEQLPRSMTDRIDRQRMAFDVDTQNRVHVVSPSMDEAQTQGLGLAYLTNTSGSWTFSIAYEGNLSVGSGFETYPYHIDVDAADVRHVTFRRSTTGNGEALQYLRNDGSGWQVSTVAEKAPGPGVSMSYDESDLAVTSDGVPHVVYLEDFHTIRHATLVNGTFASEVAVNGGSSNLSALRVVNNADTPAVVYEDAGATLTLRVARPAGPAWSTESVASFSNFYVMTSSPVPGAGGSLEILVMSSDPDPGSYDSTWTLKHFSHPGAQWIAQAVDVSEDLKLDLGRQIDAIVDPQGHTHAVYVETLRRYPSGRPIYSTNALGSWASTALPYSHVDTIQRLRIARSPTGALGILAGTSTSTEFLTDASGSWTHELIRSGVSNKLVELDPDGQSVEYWDEDASNAKAALVFDAGGIPHAAFFAGGQLIYAVRNGSWSDEPVIDLGDTFSSYSTFSPALHIASGTPKIAYFNNSRELILATRNSGTWTHQVLPTDIAPGTWFDPQIAFDPAGYVHVVANAFYFGSPQGLTHYQQTASTPIYETVDDNTQFSLGGIPPEFGPVSIAFESHGRPVVSYFDRMLQFLRVARLHPWGWRPVIVDPSDGAGFSNSVAVGSDDVVRVSYWKSVDRYAYTAAVQDAPSGGLLPGGIYDFGAVAFGSQPTLTIELKSIGEQDLQILGIEGPSGAFDLLPVMNDCRSLSQLSPGQSCSLKVRFTPQTAPSTSLISIETNEPIVSSEDLELTGYGYERPGGGGGGGMPPTALVALMGMALLRRNGTTAACRQVHAAQGVCR